MKKVIIIDDRPERRNRLLDEVSLNKLKKLQEQGNLEISEGIDGEYSNYLNEYDIIAVHRTYLTNEGIYNSFTKYTEKNKKLSILFSGGNSQNMIRNHGNQLLITATDFYSPEILDFFDRFCNNDSYPAPLLQLLYGKAWRLTLLLQYRHLLWTYEDIDDIENEEDDYTAESLQKILWNGDSSISMEDVNKEIEIEKHNRIYR